MTGTKVCLILAFHYNEWEGDPGDVRILDEDNVCERVVGIWETPEMAQNQAEGYLEDHDIDEVWGPVRSVSLYEVKLKAHGEHGKWLGSLQNFADAEWAGPGFEKGRLLK